ncbi:hypothetical protein GCM10009868_04060 [Terrabacter aerolatus]|uniref:Uncharacterized protein n=1 Tax=Terrabacter aerolatus TaxID=422442 RepID=A0A512CZC6_9MICO|nr:hypothetical protein [Terrabacter aerolatus]GEO29571.1 hypothetical protein TAE01_13810 [Terrabacter aerolatus]
MPGPTEYEQDYIDACRSRIESQVAVFQEVARSARDHGDADVSALESALESLEYEYFNNMLIVLDGCFAERRRTTGAAADGGALDEVRVLARSLTANGGTVLADPAVPLDPTRSVLGLEVGAPVTLTLQQYRRISDAFLREIERRSSATQD